jgi:hypothetical protein
MQCIPPKSWLQFASTYRERTATAAVSDAIEIEVGIHSVQRKWPRMASHRGDAASRAYAGLAVSNLG